jgi:peptide/nickel transport system substrate-binding protein
MKKIFLAIALLAALSMGAAQTLVYGISGFPSSLDSADSTDGNSLTVSGQITEQLIGFEAGSTDLRPLLATSWESNDSADVWTISLREGVTFHDGSVFDADAVKFNFDRWLDLEHPHSYRDAGKTFVPVGWVFGGTYGEGAIASVEVVDDMTVRFNMAAPAPFFPAQLASSYFQLDSPQAVMEFGADYGTPGVGSVGTGPFTFVEWSEGERVLLSRNDNYWGGPAGVAEVVIRGIQEPTSRLAELQAGTLDIAVLLNPDDQATIEADPNLATAIADGELNVGYLAMHQANEPFDDVRVRRAVAHAIDRQAIVDAFYPAGVVAETHMPGAFFGQGEGWPYEYNPELARALLTEAGYSDGFDTELWFMPVSRPYFPTPQPIAEVFGSYLADVGIRAELLTEDWTTYLSDYQTGKFPMYMLGWNGDYADPDNFLTTFFGPSAVDALGWDSPEVRDILLQARQVPGMETRASLYAQANDMVADQAPSIPMANNATLNAYRSVVQGYVMSPLGYSSVNLHVVTKTE